MKKYRVLSLVLALMLLMTMLPLSAFAMSNTFHKYTAPNGDVYTVHHGRGITHWYKYKISRNGHGLGCKDCDDWHSFEPHVDPSEADEDGRCFCGYKFMDNAQINVLWMRGVQLSPRFHRDKLEYTGKLLQDVDEISMVTVKLFDEKATLEEPENYKLKPGANVFKFTVTAEDQKTTQTYTVTIEK